MEKNRGNKEKGKRDYASEIKKFGNLEVKRTKTERQGRRGEDALREKY